MQNFTTKIVNMMKSEGLYASQGGPIILSQVSVHYNTRTMKVVQKFNSPEKWQEFNELIPSFDQTTLRENKLLEQTGITKDSTDYLWYTMRVEQDSPDSQQTLEVGSRAHVLHAFVNGIYAGESCSAHGAKNELSFYMNNNITLRHGTNNISLLSVTVGLSGSGAYLERRVLGLRRVKIGGKDYSMQPWGYKTRFDAPPGDDPIALNLGSMGKGAVWVNGWGIGRYWVSFLTRKGEPSQKWYHVPRSFLKPTGNLLVIFEEEIGNPVEITLDVVSITKTLFVDAQCT
ncbi:Beta-galactosidase 16, partial [Cucurbita argyrosperma subsp. sororia]